MREFLSQNDAHYQQKRFAQIEALESDAALLEKSSTPLDELSSYSDEQSFSAQQFTSDVDSAAIHKITEDDMPWLSDQQAIVRSYDQSNTVIANVDEKTVVHYSEWILERPPKAQQNDKTKCMTTEEKQRFETLVMDWSL